MSETAWGPPARIRGGVARDEALRVFAAAVNKPGTMFSTDRWLAPKIERLHTLLSDPLTADQAAALLDVLYERHYMRDLLEWLERPVVEWRNFFALQKFEAEERRRQKPRFLLCGTPLLWAARRERALRPLAEIQAEFLPHARCCPHCGTPPQYLEWFYQPGPGWSTRCRLCETIVDSFD